MRALRSTAMVLGLSLSLFIGLGEITDAATPTGGTGQLSSSVSELPPGVCYSDAIGTYYCRFKLLWPQY
jgi:hypothetical protein